MVSTNKFTILYSFRCSNFYLSLNSYPHCGDMAQKAVMSSLPPSPSGFPNVIHAFRGGSSLNGGIGSLAPSSSFGLQSMMQAFGGGGGGGGNNKENQRMRGHTRGYKANNHFGRADHPRKPRTKKMVSAPTKFALHDMFRSFTKKKLAT